ncbi:S9 family peptidase [Paractinoplanes atraurantiacus]|uniref:Dipeptidyl-peptidase-4 n=1 Tax=Paractinoplanes atraurantiacus TaxID=1036182 RepID=A0A285IMK6_9ACTN|nr:prolyl oligopeptidase family serine peptidase [Actinoplanes atraurantiacus]SNY49219.1 dipeptidyl-peptidase-4 [Actinoplanes atraurantiacus]
MLVSFPRLVGRTQGFGLGRPRRFTVGPDGKRVLFLRSLGGEDPVLRLWSLDLDRGDERLLADPAAPAGKALSAQERARRERARDRSAGISDYSADQAVRRVAFTADQQLFIVDVDSGAVTALPARAPVEDATISPDGTAVAYVHEGELRIVGTDGTGDRAVATPEKADVTYGLAEHVAGESMERMRGFWWAPDSSRLAVARVDNEPVEIWYLSDPSNPQEPPTSHRYPRAGTNNAVVSLHIYDKSGGATAVRAEYEYLVDVVWDAHGLLAVVQNRPQTVMRVLEVDPATGATAAIAEMTDDAWTPIVPGVPKRTAGGELIWIADRDDTRHLAVAGEPVTPPGLQVAELLSVDGDTILFAATEEPTEQHLWTWSRAGGLHQVTTAKGVHTGSRSGGSTVIRSYRLDGEDTRFGSRIITDLAASSPVVPKVSLLRAGKRELRTAVLFPAVWQRGERLPVLMDPYGGTAMQRAVADRGSYYVSQWFADQGFAVIVADGRGTPGRGPRWEKEAHGDNSDKLVEDQVDALHTVAALYPELDLGRVGIRGWSAGGTLAALAVLRRPDVFHAAVAGAPVTDEFLYDTHWQERYLGDPRIDPRPYENASVLRDAAKLERPLMLIHGLADDNVYPVHTMRFSAALLAAGKPHTVLPLPGASHMASDVDLLTPQLRFLQEALKH